MRKRIIWILIGVLLLGMVYALAEDKNTAAVKPDDVQISQYGDQGEQYSPLEKGDSGEDVKALQSRLTELGYYNGKISGNYLDGSYYAISDFQQKNGLAVTGKADVRTQEFLFDASMALPKKASVSAAPPSLTPVITPMPTPTATQPVDSDAKNEVVNPAPTPESIAYTKKLQKGSSSEKVNQLQTRLVELGYYQDEISGRYSDKTKAAVIAFQKNNGLPADGVTGEKTWNMLFNSRETLDAAATPRPTPAPTPMPYSITVDVTNQVITVYGLDENNEYTKVVRQMICSTGTRATPSDVGVWKLGSYRSRFPLFPKFQVYVQYWLPIVNGIGFHSLLYNTQNTMDLIVSSYRELGSRASHGCIRLLVDNAKWLYKNALKGTVVTITDKLPSDPELTQSLKPAALDRSKMLPKPTPAPTPPPAYDGTLQPPQPFRSLNKGDKGEDVYWLQMKLKELGYYTGTVTGGYYGGTQKAVKAFQKASGLSADGVAGKKTQVILYADVLPMSVPQVSPTPLPDSAKKQD